MNKIIIDYEDLKQYLSKHKSEDIDNLEYCNVVLRKLLREDFKIPTEVKEIIYQFLNRIRKTVYDNFMKNDKNILLFSSFENDKFKDYLIDHPSAWMRIYSAIYRRFRQTKDKSLAYLVLTFLALSSKIFTILSGSLPSNLCVI